MTKRDLNHRPDGRTAVSVVCVALVLLLFGGLEEGGLLLGGHAAVAAQIGGVLGALKCGTIGDKTGEGRCEDEIQANEDQDDAKKKCNESKKTLEKLDKELKDAYGIWQTSLKTYRCNSIKGVPQGRNSKSNLDKAEATVEDISKKINEQLAQGKENCALGEGPSDPRDRYERRQCKEAKIDLACYQEKKDDLIWELGILDDEKKKCTKSGTSEGYQRCKEIKDEELPDVKSAIDKAKQRVEAENRKKSCGSDS